jgi:uncharacterized protein
MKKVSLIIALSLLFFSGIASAEVQFPSPNGYINDYADILSASNKQQLESITKNLKQNTGAELAVAIVQSVAPLDSKLYAVKLFEKWGIGEKGKDNGVLLLVALDERRVEIEVGYGLEGVLTDAMCGRILDSFAVPNFRKGEMGEGILQTSQALAKVIAKEEIAFADTSEETGGLPMFIPAALVLPLIVLFVILIIVGLIYKNVWIPTLSAGGIGALVGYLTDEIGVVIFMAFFFGVFGLIFAVIRKYGVTSGGGGSGGWSSGGGGFSSGGSGGSSFGGGSSGGGGAGRSW